ncbi:squalene/phytoene synthase family protein [Lapillicoccus sp.]|uniref:phytoene/squalene synthase family protein n=1 Tax=Lapillicoccus sp. TaxID=1909287 RepID=UPI0025CDD363|nr:squalene/phytoene synthase family protein [Lapillicoccus sp.]
MSMRVPLRSTRRPVASDTDLYDRVAQEAAATVIRYYSTSFGLACRLLGQPVRDRVRNVYALVRLADEIVDGPLGVHHPARAGALLDRLEEDTAEAVRDGYSTNLIVHAFALTARACAIEDDLIAPFFASMRADLTVREHDATSFDGYVYGSAEVVGLMCLRIFVADGAAAPDATPGVPVGYDDLAPGARRLGAAFQKINFLRDLADDHEQRGRSYFPGIDPDHLTEDDKGRILDDIDADLAAAAAATRDLPRSSRRAVATAQSLFTELAVRLRATPAESLRRERVRVPSATKARIALTAVVRDGRS